MNEEKEVQVAIVGTHDYNPIKDMLNEAGVKMPPMVGIGDLTVVNNEQEKIDKVNKKDIPLPKLGQKFMLNGNEYTVIYINPGHHRFTCEPCIGVY